MNNNVMSHRANIVNQYFEAETLKKIEQPLKTAAIYLIKHVWGVFKGRCNNGIILHTQKTISSIKFVRFMQGCYLSKGEEHKY